jgi:hypothetical protein
MSISSQTCSFYSKLKCKNAFFFLENGTTGRGNEKLGFSGLRTRTALETKHHFARQVRDARADRAKEEKEAKKKIIIKMYRGRFVSTCQGD